MSTGLHLGTQDTRLSLSYFTFHAHHCLDLRSSESHMGHISWNPSTQIGTQTTTSPNRKGQNGRFSKVRLWTPPGPVQFAQSPLALVPVVDIHMFTVTEDSCSLMFGVPEDCSVEDCMPYLIFIDHSGRLVEVKQGVFCIGL